jgi:hypothetical protein
MALPGEVDNAWRGLLQHLTSPLVAIQTACVAVFEYASWPPSSRRRAGASWALLLSFCGFAVVLAGQQELGVAMFVQHAGTMAWLPMVVTAVACALAATFVPASRSHAAALLQVIPWLARPLLPLLWLVYAGVVRLGRRWLVQPL